MTGRLYTTSVPTPVGLLTAVIDTEDRVRRIGFGDLTRLLRRHDGRIEPGDPGAVGAAMQAYVDGDVTALDTLVVSQPGSDFHQRAWAVMRTIPAGQTISYGELASRLGSQGAAQAAGVACAQNAAAPVVPCHRVVASDGSLHGYGYGLPAKRWLLDHERGEHAGQLF